MRSSTHHRRWPRRIAIAVAVVVVLAVGVPFAYIHFIEGKAPAKLTLTPSPAPSASSASTAGLATDSGSIDGQWNVGPGSVVGYRVGETLAGQKNTAVGRTSSVTGSLTITGTSVSSATFTAQMASVRSDQSQRDHQFDGRIMDVARYPTATFRLTAPIDLGSTPSIGAVHSYQATGDLTLRGQTHPVTFTINAERTSSLLEAQGEINVVFATWGISNPSLGGFVTTASNGTLEFLLHLGRGASSATAPPITSPAGGSGGLVPATTTPPLSLGG